MQQFFRPRLTDFHGIAISQEHADFAIPFLEEDIPLSLDPFLLWKSPSHQDQALHATIVNSINFLGKKSVSGDKSKAAQALIDLSECAEVGLGFSGTRKGHRMSQNSAEAVLKLFSDIPQINNCGFTHMEEIQLLIDQISSDRISDISCNYLKSFLIDYTIDQCNQIGIPRKSTKIPLLFDYRKQNFEQNVVVDLPLNPNTNAPILLVPKRWLRTFPWINYEDYFSNFYSKNLLKPGVQAPERIKILNFNRANYDMIQQYTFTKEKVSHDCKMDPLFKVLPIFSINRKFKELKTLPTGNQDSNDKKFERIMAHFLPSVLYPHLDFAKEQSRTDSGVLIRDIIFYNSRGTPFLQDIFDDYGSQQIIFELKNVREIQRDHVNQINRYLNDSLGRFGIVVTRNNIDRAILKNTIDLWSGQRKCILILTDGDMEMMNTLFESKQRDPLDVILKKYVEFQRLCPS